MENGKKCEKTSWTLWVHGDGLPTRELVVVRLPGSPRVGEIIACKGQMYLVTGIVHTEHDVVLLVHREDR